LMWCAALSGCDCLSR